MVCDCSGLLERVFPTFKLPASTFPAYVQILREAAELAFLKGRSGLSLPPSVGLPSWWLLSVCPFPPRRDRAVTYLRLHPFSFSFLPFFVSNAWLLFGLPSASVACVAFVHALLACSSFGLLAFHPRAWCLSRSMAIWLCRWFWAPVRSCVISSCAVACFPRDPECHFIAGSVMLVAFVSLGPFSDDPRPTVYTVPVAS